MSSQKGIEVFQSIGEVIHISQEQDCAQYTALGNSSLHWEEREFSWKQHFDCEWRKSENQEWRLGLNAKDREHGKQRMMPDCLECLRYVQGDGPDVLIEI